jgi:pentapeptide MXKDX repeat protein
MRRGRPSARPIRPDPGGILKKSAFAAVLLALALPAAYAQDKGMMKKDEMKKDGMMKKDAMAKKDGMMKKDAMKKDGMMKKDEMKK